MASEHSQLLPADNKTGFGKKTIDFFGGFSLLVNNMTGPGMVLLPPLMQQAGWFTPILAMIVVMIIATLSSTMLCEAMSRIPGNDKFQRKDFVSLIDMLILAYGVDITLFLFVLSLQAMNIASIIESAQTMDITILAIARITCGLEFFPAPGFVCEHTPGNEASPFGAIFVISMGFMVILLVAIPLGYFNLDDNIIVQKVAYSIFMFIAVEWFIFFIYRGLDFNRVPMFGNNQTAVLGTIIFNYAYVVSIPSWVNEKRENVSINKSLWGASLLSTSLFIILGIMGAWSYNFTNSSQDLLDVINSTDTVPSKVFHTISVITVYIFPIVTQLSGIPVFSIIIRYNLLENKICNKFWANLWGVVFPWIVAVPFYTGNGLSTIIGWTSILVNGFINYIIPLVLFILSHRALKQGRPVYVHTFGEHRQTVLAAEVITNRGSFSINQVPNASKPFVAVPHRWKPDFIAVVCIVLMSLGVLGSIIISILDFK